MKDGVLITLMKGVGYSDREILMYISGRDSGYDKGVDFGRKNKWNKETLKGVGILIFLIFSSIGFLLFGASYYDETYQNLFMQEYSCTYE